MNGLIVNLDRILQDCKICIVGLISRGYGVQNGGGVTDFKNFENVCKIKFREICCKKKTDFLLILVHILKTWIQIQGAKTLRIWIFSDN